MLVQLIGEGRYTSFVAEECNSYGSSIGVKDLKGRFFSHGCKREQNKFLLSTRRLILTNVTKSTHHLAYALGLLLYSEKSLYIDINREIDI